MTRAPFGLTEAEAETLIRFAVELLAREEADGLEGAFSETVPGYAEPHLMALARRAFPAEGDHFADWLAERPFLPQIELQPYRRYRIRHRSPQQANSADARYRESVLDFIQVGVAADDEPLLVFSPPPGSDLATLALPLSWIDSIEVSAAPPSLNGIATERPS
jgi:hypothetical protein